MLERSLDATAAGLGAGGRSWKRLLAPFVDAWDDLMPGVLAPPLQVPEHPLLMARFGLKGLRTATGLARGALEGTSARALFAGNAAHSFLPLDEWGTAAFGLMLSGSGHAVGWPIVRGGSQRLANALAGFFRSLGGEIVTDAPVEHIDEVRSAKIVMLDLSPPQIARLAKDRLPAKYRQALERYRFGAAAFKLDWALDGPVPWSAPECARSATVHLGGTLEEVTASEAAPARGEVHPAAVRSLRAAVPLRLHARAGRQAHRLGRTVTPPTGAPSISPITSSGRSSASRRASGSVSSPGASSRPRIFSAETPTSSAATSAAA